MRKNLYYHTVYQRRNLVKDILYDFFFAISSWPRLLLEVFLRRNMGERYFSLTSVVFIVVGLAYIPFRWSGYFAEFSTVLKENATWYLFLAAFLYCSVERWREIKLMPSVYDLKRFSMSSGVSFSFFYEFGFAPRIISTVLEPALGFVVGAVLWWLLKQPVGALLIVCSVIYGLSYLGAYHQGDDFVMDRIDEMICNNNLYESFVENKGPRETAGFEFLGGKPKDPEARQRVAETFWEEVDEEVPEVR